MTKEKWYDIAMPPLDLRDTPMECIGELVNAIIANAYADYFGTNAYAADDAERWFREKRYTWLTDAPLDKYLKELEDMGALENPKNENGTWGREGRYQNRFFVPNRTVRKAMNRRKMRISDLARALLMPESDMRRLLQSEQPIEVQKAWARICMKQPYRIRGNRFRLWENFEREGF